ncbi:hypothetical protein [Devosia sp.]|uniref:hypothetical protein n=1 Tax=Devosia sp. TaxID=1871048 RepID=UPI002733AF81|nr:hypothetical protein [Devosia sp.]MDP2778883.1 hypothetical protein [Devosia sp.]
MKFRLNLTLGAVLVAGLLGLDALPAFAEPNRVTFPDIDALEHYTTVIGADIRVRVFIDWLVKLFGDISATHHVLEPKCRDSRQSPA